MIVCSFNNIQSSITSLQQLTEWLYRLEAPRVSINAALSTLGPGDLIQVMTTLASSFYYYYYHYCYYIAIISTNGFSIEKYIAPLSYRTRLVDIRPPLDDPFHHPFIPSALLCCR